LNNRRTRQDLKPRRFFPAQAFDDDVIKALVYPAPPKNRPGKTTVSTAGKKTGS
jgi:hypothetical protein